MRVFIGMLLVLALMSVSCKSGHPGNTAPPGQVKKITGSKSAKPYAPGQRKKDFRTN